MATPLRLSELPEEQRRKTKEHNPAASWWFLLERGLAGAVVHTALYRMAHSEAVQMLNERRSSDFTSGGSADMAAENNRASRSTPCQSGAQCRGSSQGRLRQPRCHAAQNPSKLRVQTANQGLKIYSSMYTHLSVCCNYGVGVTKR